MKKIRLSFCEISFLEDNIVEVITDKGVEINAALVEEYHNFYKNTFDCAFGVLVTKKYDYSYDFPAMLKIGDLENLKAVAVLHFSDFSKTAHMVNKIP